MHITSLTSGLADLRAEKYGNGGRPSALPAPATSGAGHAASGASSDSPTPDYAYAWKRAEIEGGFRNADFSVEGPSKRGRMDPRLSAMYAEMKRKTP